MSSIILIFATLIALAGLALVLKPDSIITPLKKYSTSPILHALAVIARLVIGLLLLAYADISKFPLIIQIFGWVAIIAAIVFAVIGRANFKRMMSRAIALGSTYARPGGVVAMAFGGFLIYAFM